MITGVGLAGIRRAPGSLICVAVLVAASSSESPVADAAQRGDHDAVRAQDLDGEALDPRRKCVDDLLAADAQRECGAGAIAGGKIAEGSQSNRVTFKRIRALRAQRRHADQAQSDAIVATTTRDRERGRNSQCRAHQRNHAYMLHCLRR